MNISSLKVRDLNNDKRIDQSEFNTAVEEFVKEFAPRSMSFCGGTNVVYPTGFTKSDITLSIGRKAYLDANFDATTLTPKYANSDLESVRDNVNIGLEADFDVRDSERDGTWTSVEIESIFQNGGTFDARNGEIIVDVDFLPVEL